jgi:hypothetical protein
LPAMHFNAPRLSWLPALSFTTIATSQLLQGPRPGRKFRATRNSCRSRLAGDGLECAALVLFTRVIVDDHRWLASSYKGPGAQLRRAVRLATPATLTGVRGRPTTASAGAITLCTPGIDKVSPNSSAHIRTNPPSSRPADFIKRFIWFFLAQNCSAGPRRWAGP